MKTVFDIYKELRSTTKLIKKRNILNIYSKNKDLKKYLKLACDPNINFYIRKIPEYQSFRFELKPLFWAFDQLSVLSSRAKTGNDAKEHLKKILSSINENDQIIIKNIIAKDAKCGVGFSIIDKIWPGLIEKRPYQRFPKETETGWNDIEYPAISTCKEDGEFIDHEIYGDKEEYRQITRGNIQLDFGKFHEIDFEKIYELGNIVIQTEALVLDDETGDYLPREKGNGIINSNITQNDIERIRFKVLNIVQLDSFKSGLEKTRYIDRIDLVKSICEIMDSEYFIPVDYEIVNNRDEAIIVHEKRRKLGKEGSVLYSYNSPWKNTNSGVKGTMKQKQREPIDMIITETKPYKPTANDDQWPEDDERWNWIGSLKFESTDGIVSVWCGSLKEDIRRLNPNDLIGKIGIVNANDVLPNKDGNGYTLFLAATKTDGSFIRNDKTEADSFEDICNSLKAKRFLKKAKRVSKNTKAKIKKTNLKATNVNELEW